MIIAATSEPLAVHAPEPVLGLSHTASEKPTSIPPTCTPEARGEAHRTVADAPTANRSANAVAVSPPIQM